MIPLFEMQRSFIFRFLLYFIFILIIQELCLRLCFPIPELKNFDRSYYMKDEIDNHNVAHQKNISWYWESTPDTNNRFIHYMNRYGFRDNEWKVKKRNGSQRFMFVGDSFVEGVMASQEETIPKGFRSFLERDNVEIMNFGMLGRGLNSYLKVITDAIPIFKPDVIMLCVFSNDLSDKTPLIPSGNLDPEYFNFFVPRIIELIREARKNRSINFRWFIPEKRFLPFVPEKQSPLTKHEGEIRKHVRADLVESMRRGRSNPFRTNQILREKEMLAKEPNLGNAFNYIKSYAELHEVELIIYYIPARSMITNHYYQYEKEYCLKECVDPIDLTSSSYQVHRKALKEKCESLDIPFLDLSNFIKEKESQNKHLYWNYDDHMKGESYLLLGQELHNFWSQLKGIEE